MKLLLTGGTGAVGTTATNHFLSKGWDVRVIGIEPNSEIDGIDYRQCDITDFAAVAAAVEGCDYVVHLAAVSNPVAHPGEAIFNVNAGGTYNVFEAAAQAGIKRIVQASSINAFGCFWGTIDRPPEYLPLDEDQDSYTTDAYSFSKEIVENICDYYWRRDGISSVALRFPGVWNEERKSGEEFEQRKREARQLLDELLALPDSERQTRIKAAQKAAAAYRQQRPLEYPAALDGFATEGIADNPLAQHWIFSRLNYWSHVDVRDAAQAMEKGLTANYTGSHALFITAAQNWIGYSSVDLCQIFYPDVDEVRGNLSGTASLVSIEKARRLIGYEPKY